ncbi:hypothetical protein ZEAMMB73_Zm00001d028563 [Zea mays]|uniref:Uncharacterized protein n=1 Tax=Zea mays TaxID=4577 RepID=A0A1D6JXJ8_MAIZE|nr:hypothetical protein ZEAMMB73_Zm00001d028563 [Zea mays]
MPARGRAVLLWLLQAAGCRGAGVMLRGAGRRQDRRLLVPSPARQGRPGPRRHSGGSGRGDMGAWRWRQVGSSEETLLGLYQAGGDGFSTSFLLLEGAAQETSSLCVRPCCGGSLSLRLV